MLFRFLKITFLFLLPCKFVHTFEVLSTFECSNKSLPILSRLFTNRFLHLKPMFWVCSHKYKIKDILREGEREVTRHQI